MTRALNSIYDNDFRTTAVAQAESALSRGQPMADMARKLGVAPSLLYRWRATAAGQNHKSKPVKPIKRVTLIPDTNHNQTMPTSGAVCILGLGIRDIAELLRQLS